MYKMNIFFAGLVLAVAAIFVYGFVLNTEDSEELDSYDVYEQEASTVKTNNEGPVTVTVEPISVSEKEKVWIFKISLDTHSVNLDEDLTELLVLADDVGNEYVPVAWKGDSAGGHHRSGTLSFKAFPDDTDYIELIMKNVGSIEERRFAWEMTDF